MNELMKEDQLSIVTERKRLRLEVPTDDSKHVVYLSLQEARQLQTQLSQSIIRIFQDRYAPSMYH